MLFEQTGTAMGSGSHRWSTVALIAFVTSVSIEAQSQRTIYVGGGLGHMVFGSGNPPILLTSDMIAVASDGGSEGYGVPDDQLVVVRGFDEGNITVSAV